MKLNIFFVYLILLVGSCSSKDEERLGEELDVKKALEKKSCQILILNLAVSADDVSYSIWKKYGVLVDGHIGDMTMEDSCFYEAMRQLIIDKNGEAVVNDIILETEKLMKRSPIEGIRYSDGAYGHLLNSRLVDGEGAKIVNEMNYYKVLDSLEINIRENISEGLLSFWITVDTSGKLGKVELINQKCEDIIYDKIVGSLKNLKWNPAIFNNTPVNYRFRETIFVGKRTAE